MIQGIRRKFILIAVAVLSAAMLLLAVVINVTNWINVRDEMEATLQSLSESTESSARGSGPGRKGRSRHMQNTLDESRYFRVLLKSGGDFSISDTSRIYGASANDLTAIVTEALSTGQTTGMVDGYLFLINAGESGRGDAVFLNCETKMDGVRNLLLISGIACISEILIAWLLVLLFSKKAVQPMIRNAVQQKQFITDAGHELKTPLTVISANMDALELKTEPSEWIDSTREQLSNMSGLVNNMIYLSRMDEDGASLKRENVNLSDLVEQEAGPFQSMAEFMGKTLEINAEEGICLQGDRDALARMINQLCDNAMKYSPEEDLIRLSLSRSGREIRLDVENSLKEPLPREALDHLFDRFYRPDASRSRESGGYGIGLSMVRAIMEKHEGRVWAETIPENRILFRLRFP